MWLGVIALVGTLLKRAGGLMTRAGPLIYPALFLLVAYSISAGNAGTAFRYRTHLVAFLLAVVCTLRETRVAVPAPAASRERGAVRHPAIPQGQPT
jgi:hypothetical protein